MLGLSNFEVAKYLLEKGLAEFEGVVFLDERDRKVILIRQNMKVSLSLSLSLSLSVYMYIYIYVCICF